MTDPFVGQLTFVRVYSGVLSKGDTVYNPVKGKKERIGRIVQMHANERLEVDDPDEPVVEDRDRLVEQGFHRRDGDPARLVRGLALGLDLGPLRLGDRRGPFEGVHRGRV